MHGSESDGAIVTGGCLCGRVRFEINLPTLFCVHCHCSMCRRNHRASFVSVDDGLPRLGGKSGLEPRS